MPSENCMRAFRLVSKLRYKYENASDKLTDMQRKKCTDILNNICGRSLGIVGWTDYLLGHHTDDWSKCCQAVERNRQRKKRCRRYLREMFAAHTLRPNQFYFITMTFSDSTLENTSFQTRRQYVTRWCKENLTDYYGNVDFGSKNGREHYHIAAFVPESLIDANARPISRYGFVNWKPIKIDMKSANRLGNYINKLTNHAWKESASNGFHARGAAGHKCTVKWVDGEKCFMYDMDELPF